MLTIQRLRLVSPEPEMFGGRKNFGLRLRHTQTAPLRGRFGMAVAVEIGQII